MQGGAAHWWNFRHHQHHAKPNVFKKDPDITVPQLFMVGDVIPLKWGLQKRGMAPYQHQHKYFWLCKSQREGGREREREGKKEQVERERGGKERTS